MRGVKDRRPWREVWREVLLDSPFHFLALAALIGAPAFFFLFDPAGRGDWRAPWHSGSAGWGVAWWLVALLCASSGLRGLRLRVLEWRKAVVRIRQRFQSSEES